MKIISNFSANYSNKIRLKKDIEFVIFHYTGMQSEIESIERLKNPKHKVSCHYLINRKGIVIQMVKELNVAWHAGKSKWKKFNNLNIMVVDCRGGLLIKDFQILLGNSDQGNKDNRNKMTTVFIF